ncbi:hypothetical protein QQS21_003556 [Conoideocrella luteorostrata]|uniref:HD domain-containing protein n=1 Tax=Conoideocrella luteorostrata TaxID=1105319 RepID=A0AAJ0CU03_9HYPO|nr:hypothetical protein QQS21_003556 [Conoideocrella luteorostrata]
MAQNDVIRNGWTPVPIDAGRLFNGKSFKNTPTALKVDGIEFPLHDPVVMKVRDYAKEKLPSKTYNHSMRVYYYASAIIKQQFPEVVDNFSPSTMAIACLLHDIGTTDENMAATRMSFEFYGGFKALQILKECGASQDQADAACEAIVRHQDLGTDGTITFLGQLLQLATIFDNVSDHPYMPDIKDLIHVETREDVIKAFPRTGWLGCFAMTVQKETGLKPWSHTTHIPDFAQKILDNKLMRPYE